MPARFNLIEAAIAGAGAYPAARVRSVLREPLILVSAPRSGSTLLFEQLMRIAGFWSIGGESHAIFHAFPHLGAENSRLDSGGLDERHADRRTRDLVRACFLFLLRDHNGARYLDRPSALRPAAARLLEKTPRNALNIPFLLQVFPAARFIYLHRAPRESVASLIEAWTLGLRTGRFVTFGDLPGWDRPAWCFLLPPGWRRMRGKTLAEIAAFQWSASNEIILRNLSALSRDRWTSVSYEALVGHPAKEISRLVRFAELDGGERLPDFATLPVSGTALTAPHPDKWRRHAREIERLYPLLRETSDRIAAAGA